MFFFFHFKLIAFSSSSATTAIKRPRMQIAAGRKGIHKKKHRTAQSMYLSKKSRTAHAFSGGKFWTTNMQIGGGGCVEEFRAMFIKNYFSLLCDSIKISRQSSLFINCSKLNKMRVVARMILVQHKQVAAPINILVKPKQVQQRSERA